MRRLLAIATPLILLTACQQAEPAQEAEGTVAQQLNEAQQAFAEANARMHEGMASIPADADEAFMRGMLAHHRGAVEMAEIQLQHGKDPKARELAQAIISAQQTEIEQMERWLADRPAAAAEPAGHVGHH